jgi:hypothetical protein
MEEKLEIFKKYLKNNNKNGEHFIDDIWIRSNKHYIFFGEENKVGKTFALFSKKYLMTVELSKDVKVRLVLDKIAEIIDMYRKENGLAIEKFEFWLPHCIVNGNKVDVKLVAESFGISRDLALDYMVQYDEVFSEVYRKGKYFGLPLFESYDKAVNYPLKDNSREYIKGLRKVQKIMNN